MSISTVIHHRQTASKELVKQRKRFTKQFIIDDLNVKNEEKSVVSKRKVPLNISTGTNQTVLSS